MPPSVAETYVMMKPRSEWPDPSKTKAEFVAELEEAVEHVPGNNYEFTQPIQMRFNELISGVRADVAVKIYRRRSRRVARTRRRVEALLQKIPGAADVKTGTDHWPAGDDDRAGTRLRTLRAQCRRRATSDCDCIRRQGPGQIFEGDRRFDLVVRLPETMRGNLRNTPRIAGAIAGVVGFVPLSGLVANIDIAPGPNAINRENGKRRVVITANVRGRDLGGFVAEIQERVQMRSNADGYWVEYGGTFEQLISASQRLQLVVPLVAADYFRDVVYGVRLDQGCVAGIRGVPLALTGGMFALALRDIPLSISAGSGIYCAVGRRGTERPGDDFVYPRLRPEGQRSKTRLSEGALTRLRPVLMTALVAALGFVPMALNTGIGAEVQRPLATVVIGGIISSTLLTLLVLPVLYRLVSRGDRFQTAIA